ncbi:PREDICTED: uncharacterized protein LOC108762267 [Trachymyrmex cornetzi]|uniref:uncharacterized protein LOC108762267 n=1 Tax=Trachymyrmex cornetzi TaxID=471704 RepID=UPI00084F08D9|nr:PREDICTED: uncharacterized protein LOC108762267 [Trachymyrmex cornetzi]
MTLKAIPKFERLNAVSINVYGIENKQILPLRLTGDKKEKHVNLLYLQDPRNDSISHFAWIKNLSRLVSSQLTRKEHKKYFCDRCLHYFDSSQKLQTHKVDCQSNFESEFEINDSLSSLSPPFHPPSIARPLPFLPLTLPFTPSLFPRTPLPLLFTPSPIPSSSPFHLPYSFLPP